MITKNHPSAYAELFRKAQDVLKKYMNSDYAISNIDEYFACLRDLAQIERDHPNEIDPIFTILPATEETFNIDANTRSISIPSNFARYGVGVEGDEIAEILYFSIDRYFDAMDLSEMDIIIQWKHANDPIDLYNFSATYKKSLTLQPGKIVFGWPITSEITEKSGNIQFSVRFYRHNPDNNELIYSFSTLTTTIKIQAGLNFNLDEAKYAPNISDKIFANLVNSTIPAPDYVIAAPEFVGYYTYEENEFKLANDNRTYDLPINFVVKAEVPIKNTQNGEVVSGNGLTYEWINENKVSFASNYIYKEISNKDYNPNEIYYQLADSGEYEPYYVSGDDNLLDNDITLYTKHSILTPTIAGTYKAIAKNIYKQGHWAIAESQPWIIPGAETPEFNYEDLADTYYIPSDVGSLEIEIPVNSIANNDLMIDWFKDDQAIDYHEQSYLVAEEGSYYIEATHIRNEDTKTSKSKKITVWHSPSKPILNYSTSFIFDENLCLTVAYDALLYSTSVSYQWYKRNTATREWELIPNAIGSSYKPLEEGNYKCRVTNNYHGKEEFTETGTIAVIPV